MVRNDNTATSCGRNHASDTGGAEFDSSFGSIVLIIVLAVFLAFSKQMLGLYFKINHDHYTVTQHCDNKSQYRSNYSPLLDPTQLGPIISHPCPYHEASPHVSFATSKPKGCLGVQTFTVGKHISK